MIWYFDVRSLVKNKIKEQAILPEDREQVWDSD